MAVAKTQTTKAVNSTLNIERSTKGLEKVNSDLQNTLEVVGESTANLINLTEQIEDKEAERDVENETSIADVTSINNTNQKSCDYNW